MESNHDQCGKGPRGRHCSWLHWSCRSSYGRASCDDARGEVAGVQHAIRDCLKANFTQLSDPCKKALHCRHQDDLAEKNGTTPTQPPATDAPATTTPTQQGTARRVLAANDVPTAETVSSPLVTVAADSMTLPRATWAAPPAAPASCCLRLRLLAPSCSSPVSWPASRSASAVPAPTVPLRWSTNAQPRASFVPRLLWGCRHASSQHEQLRARYPADTAHAITLRCLP